MRELQLFTNVEFGHIRRMEVNGKPYVVASDVAKILGYKNPSKATNDHCKKSKMKVGTDSLGHRQTFKVIPESDIYRLIQCCKTKSEQFRESFINNLISEGLLSDNYKILISRDEIEFLDQLEEALKPFNIKGIRQYHVLNYRIDYYCFKNLRFGITTINTLVLIRSVYDIGNSIAVVIFIWVDFFLFFGIYGNAGVFDMNDKLKVIRI